VHQLMVGLSRLSVLGGWVFFQPSRIYRSETARQRARVLPYLNVSKQVPF